MIYVHAHGIITTVKMVAICVSTGSAPLNNSSPFLPPFPPPSSLFLPPGSSATTPCSVSLLWPSRGFAPCACCESSRSPFLRGTLPHEGPPHPLVDRNVPTSLLPRCWAGRSPCPGPQQGQLCPKWKASPLSFGSLTEAQEYMGNFGECSSKVAETVGA